MEYKIVTGTTSYEVDRQVNRMQKTGWKPLGGVSVATHSHNMLYFAQAMVKEK